jgi:hypothetical protein
MIGMAWGTKIKRLIVQQQRLVQIGRLARLLESRFNRVGEVVE